MSTLKNKVNLIGHIGQNPETKSFKEGRSLTRFSLATNERYKDKEGIWQDKTEWHNIVAWGTLGENICKFASKGTEIILEGRLSYNQYETKTGEKRTSSEIEVHEFHLLSKKESLQSTGK